LTLTNAHVTHYVIMNVILYAFLNRMVSSGRFSSFHEVIEYYFYVNISFVGNFAKLKHQLTL